MTFTRQSDSTTLTPVRVLVPLDQARPSATIARRVAQSSAVRVTYVGAPGPRDGELRLLFSTYATANAASLYFAASSLFDWDGADVATSDYTIVADRIFETADVDEGDYALTFAVVESPRISGSDDEGWELTVPYLEVPE